MSEYLDDIFGDEGKRKKSKEERRATRSGSGRATVCTGGGGCDIPSRHQKVKGLIKKIPVKTVKEEDSGTHINPRYLR